MQQNGHLIIGLKVKFSLAGLLKGVLRQLIHLKLQSAQHSLEMFGKQESELDIFIIIGKLHGLDIFIFLQKCGIQERVLWPGYFYPLDRRVFLNHVKLCTLVQQIKNIWNASYIQEMVLFKLRWICALQSQIQFTIPLSDIQRMSNLQPSRSCKLHCSALDQKYLDNLEIPICGTVWEF